jgi:hypothetical protein
MAKSPVYGMGRNRKHRGIHRAANHPAAANINMRGKKTKRMSCWCCVCIDMRDEIRDEEHRKEMRDRGMD